MIKITLLIYYSESNDMELFNNEYNSSNTITIELNIKIGFLAYQSKTHFTSYRLLNQ